MTLFAYPSMAVWFAAPVVLWFLALAATRLRRRSLESLGQLPTIHRLLPPWLPRRRRWIVTLRVLALVLWTIALAGPLIGARLSEFKERGLDVFIAVDCSLSMQAQDLPPSRMAHAKLVLGQLVDRLIGSRIGIIAFAGQAYVQCPLTIDQSAAQDALQDLDVGTVPIPGTHIGDAIRVAVQGLKAGEGGHRVLVLLTDGEDHRSDPLGAAKDAARVGLKIFAIGIGSPQGEPIPIYDDQGHRTGYKRDKSGEVVMSRVDESSLSQITQLTGGRYYRAESTGNEVEPLVRALGELQQGETKEKVFNRYENRFQWPLVLGILLFLISLAIPETRRKAKVHGPNAAELLLKKVFLTLLPFALCVMTCRSAFASPAQLKEGNRLFKKGDYADALKLYNDALIDAPNSSTLHFNAGDAAYQSGDFAGADTFFKQASETAFPALKAAALYNQGNALFRQQKRKEAIEAYKASLRVNPQDENAKYNLGIAMHGGSQNPPPSASPKNGQGNPKPSGGGNDQKKAEGQNGNPPPNPGEMSREDAERLLAAAGAGEPHKSNQRFPKSDAPHPDEDW